jgi:CheY-like chemotaxis protein
MEVPGLRVLIVDDNPTGGEMVRHLVNAWRMHATVTDNGPAALESLRHAQVRGLPFDLLLLDDLMPRMDGAAVARAVREDPDLRTTRIILLSSNMAAAPHPVEPGPRTATAVEDPLEVAPFDGCLIRPFRQSELFDTIVKTLRRDAPEETPERGPAGPPTARYDMRILLAEDNEINQMMAREMLQIMGCEVAIASNGREALALLDTQLFDLVLMDCQMPLMDGFEATRQIRSRTWERRGGGEIPIVALTANVMKEDKERCRAAGMDDHISKPFRMADVAAVLSRWKVYSEGAGGKHKAAPVAGDTARHDVVGRDSDALAPTAGVLDQDALDALGKAENGGSLDLLRRFTELMVQTTPREMDAIDGAISQSACEEVQRIAHSLKSTSAWVGAMALSNCFMQLEGMGRDAALEGAREVLARAREEFVRVEAALGELALLPAGEDP